MNLLETILKTHSQAQCLRIVKWVGTDKKRFAELVKLVFKGEFLVAQRASWPLSYCVEACPELALPYIEKFMDNLSKPGHHIAVLRNTMRLFQYVDVPEKYLGKLLDLSLRLMQNASMPPAVRAFSMTVAGNIAAKEPELKREIEMVIRELMVEGGPAIQARGKQTLKQLSKAGKK